MSVKIYGRIFLAATVSFFIFWGVSICNSSEVEKGRILFADNFSNADYVKENWDIKTKWIINDKGELDINNMNEGVLASIKNSKYGDVAFELKMKIMEKGENYILGFFLRDDEKEKKMPHEAAKRLRVLVKDMKGGEHYSSYILPGEVEHKTEGLKKEMVSREFKTGEWYKIKFVCVKRKIELWINDEYMGLIENENIPLEGAMGIRLYCCHVVFDDVKIIEAKEQEKR